MDFQKLIATAAKKQHSAEKQLQVNKNYTTQLSAPKKEKKDGKIMSDAVKKLVEEKEREKQEQERKRIEEEKQARFRIPKVGKDKSKTEEKHHSSSTSNKHSSSSSSNGPSSSKHSSSTSNKHSSSSSSNGPSSSKHSTSTSNKHSSSSSNNGHSSSKHSSSSSSNRPSSSKHSSSTSNKHSSSSSIKHSSSSSSKHISSTSKHSSSSSNGNSSKTSSKNSKEQSDKNRKSSDKSARNDTSSVGNSERNMTADLLNDSDSIERAHPENRKEIVLSDNTNTKVVAADTPSSNATKKLSEEEKLRIRKEFEAKVARLKANLSRDKEERVNFSEGKIGFKRDYSKVENESEKSKDEAGGTKSKQSKHSSSASTKEGSKQSTSDKERKRRKHKHKDRPDKQPDNLLTKSKMSYHPDKLNKSSNSGITTQGKNLVLKKTEKPKQKILHLNKNKQAPAMNFAAILKMAQEKAKDPVPFVKKTKPVKEPEKEERPLTQEEKDKRERYMEHKERTKNAGNGMMKKDHAVAAKSNRKSEQSSSILKSELQKGKSHSSSTEKQKEQVRNTSSKSDCRQNSSVISKHNSSLNKGDKSMNKPTSSNNSRSDQSNVSFGKSLKQCSRTPVSTSSEKRPQSVEKSKNNHHSTVSKGGQPSSTPSKPGLHLKKTINFTAKNSGGTANKTSIKPSSSSNQLNLKRKLQSSSKSVSCGGSAPKKGRPSEGKYDVTNENVLICGPPKNREEKPAKPAVASNPWDRIYGQIQQNNPKTVKKKREMVIVSDSDEYDEEMDDFIADSDEEIEEHYANDYSKHIRDIFGYDKRKYKYESDYEIANMESNFREQMKEEARSARLGLQEDLEDIKKEEEELRRKALAKKKSKR